MKSTWQTFFMIPFVFIFTLVSCGGALDPKIDNTEMPVVKLGQDARQKGPRLVHFKGDLEQVRANVPFPQSLTFKNAIKPNHKTQEQLNKDVAQFYQKWRDEYLKNYPGADTLYIEGDFTGGEPKGWPKNIKGISTSEATGYGMIIFALMAGYDPLAKTYFDGLVKLYLANESELNNKTMSWIVPNAQKAGLQKSSGATDGDFDIAYGLILADKQWGSEGPLNYKKLAKALIENGILEFDISKKTNRILMGDWGKGQTGAVGGHPFYRYNETSTRPSDWILDHLKVFNAEFPSDRWIKTIDEVYAVMTAVQDPKTGLFPDFVEDVNGKPQKAIKDLKYTDDAGQQKLKFLESDLDDTYNWNACRVPWRIATDFAHYGTPVSKAALDKLNNWTTTLHGDPEKWAENIWHGYTLDGQKNNPDDDWSWALAFSAPMVSALIANTDPAHQAYLNGGWDFVSRKFLGDHKQTEGWSGYFSDTIGLMNLLLISGNWWNPAEVPKQ